MHLQLLSVCEKKNVITHKGQIVRVDEYVCVREKLSWLPAHIVGGLGLSTGL